MSAVTDLIALHEAQYGPRSGAPSTGGSAFAPIVEYLKKQQYEKRRQANVKQQMSQAQQMMQAMSQMPDNSSNARAIGTLEDDVQKRRKGVISVSDYVPEQSISTDETGALNIKMGYRRATPAEQKSQYELQRSQIEAEKAQAKADLLSAYVRGEVQDGAILGEMSTLGITPDDFDVAAQARERLRQVSNQQAVPVRSGTIPKVLGADGMTGDNIDKVSALAGGGDIQPEGTGKQIPVAHQQVQAQPKPAQESFRFKKDDSVAEQRLAMDKQKFERETKDAERANQAKREAAIDAASQSISAIDHLLDNVNYFGPIEGRMPAGMNTGKREWAKNYDFLESKNVLNVLSEMKSQSRTGATGFGALNEKELGIIQNAAMRLDKQLDEKTAAKYLNEMKTAFQKIISREQNGYENESGVQQTTGSVPAVGGTFNGEKVISVKRIK